MSATCGPPSQTPLAYFDPDEYCWRTSQGTFPWDSTPSSLTLPRWGTTRRGALCELPTPALLTDESGSSSLLGTPRVTTSGMSASQTAVDRGEHRSRLEAQVALLPTLTAQEPGGTADRYHERLRRADGREPTFLPLGMTVTALLPTPVADHSRGLPQPGTDFQSLPNVALSLLPTPKACDGKRGRDLARPRPDTSGRELATALAFAGVPTSLPSDDGSTSWDDQLPDLLSLDEPESA